MSARVVRGLAPAGKPHPATKWSLLMALLVVVVLVVPQVASAGQPSVQPPTGPESGGVFTGIYTFDTYISCSGGPSFNSSYSNNLDGTHTFAFYGSADGSLLVTIDGGGYMLVTSCGNPLTGPITNVADYTVTKGTPPSPTPTPTATPTPSSRPSATPTPPAGGGTGKGSGSSGSGAATPAASGASATPTPATDTATPAPEAGSAVSSPSLETSPAQSRPSTSRDVAAGASTGANQRRLVWPVIIFAVVLIAILLAAARRSQRLRERFHTALAPLRLRLEPYWFRIRHTAWRRLPPPRARDEPKARGLSPHHHSGRLLAHHHTSYPALAFLLIVSAVLAAAVSYSSRADSSTGSTVSLTVSGPPPDTAATIDDPTDGEHVATSTITVRGTCPSGLLIEIDRNTTFAGDSICDANGLYAVLVTLVPNENDLVARDSDALGQYGPDSSTVQVFYDAPPPPPSPTPGPSPTPTPTPPTGQSRQASGPAATSTPAPPPFLLTTSQHLYQGVNVGDQIQWPVTISGGQAPYRVTWEWGDNSATSSVEASNAGAVQMEHQYAKAGSYQVTIRAVDPAGHQAVIQVVTIVNGTATAAASIGASRPEPGALVAIWPLLSLTSLVVASFWLGEHHKLAVFGPLLHPVG